MRDIRTEVPAGYTFNLVLTLIYKDNYATADKTKHTLHALQRRCCHVSSRSCGGGVGGMLYSACVRPPATMSPINDNTEQSSSIEILMCEFGTSTQAQAPHFMIAETHTHTCSKEPTLALPPILQFCRISCSRGDNKPVLQRGQPR